MDMAQYGKNQLERSHNQRICSRPSKREKKAFKYYIGKEKALDWTHLRGESLVKEVIEGRMEGKRGRGKPHIMMLDDIKADETYEKIKRRAMFRECWRNWMPRTCFQAQLQ